MEMVAVPKYLTTKEVAERIEMDHSQVRRAVAHGWLKAEKKGHTTLITEVNLQRWVDAGKPVYPKKRNRSEE